jgi:hypothetical protein
MSSGGCDINAPPCDTRTPSNVAVLAGLGRLVGSQFPVCQFCRGVRAVRAIWEQRRIAGQCPTRFVAAVSDDKRPVESLDEVSGLRFALVR